MKDKNVTETEYKEFLKFIDERENKKKKKKLNANEKLKKWLNWKK